MLPEAIPTHADILIIDDTPANLRLLSQMLTGQGYNVRAVTSGARGLASARAAQPDLILLDIRMPEMDGYQVCEQLKADPATHDVPVIFISALSEIQDKVQAFKVGGVDYITKPFQLEEVLVRTETHLALRALQKRLVEANARVAGELRLAGELQASFMPTKFPHLPGWELAAAIQSARETSGDFYDIFQLPDSRLGLVVGDVVDKGVGAALFMALCWSLIRTYAAELPEHPEQVFSHVNQRILEDIGAKQFVTVFFGVLDPTSGRLTYCNAGHNPPFLLDRSGDHQPHRKLTRTGVPLGLFEETSWECQEVEIGPGDMLVMYTDGITEAQNQSAEFFGESRLLAALGELSSISAGQVCQGLLDQVADFTSHAQPHDDIALVVVRRLAHP